MNHQTRMILEEKFLKISSTHRMVHMVLSMENTVHQASKLRNKCSYREQLPTKTVALSSSPARHNAAQHAHNAMSMSAFVEEFGLCWCRVWYNLHIRFMQ